MIKYFPYFISPKDYWEKGRFSWWYKVLLKIFHNKHRYYFVRCPNKVIRTIDGKDVKIDSQEALKKMCHCSFTDD